MKFYISGSVAHKAEVRKVMDEVEKAGHSVVLDWTKDSLLEKPYSRISAKTRFRAERDFRGVEECEVFVLVTCAPASNSGMYVEFGAALARNFLAGKPRLFVIGTHKDERLFYYHSLVERVETIEDVLKQL